MKDLGKVKTIYVHSGVTFHADDVFCCAIARSFNPDVKIVRTLTPPTDDTDDILVCDIGGGKFDHHQPDAYKDPTGHKWCSAELLYAATPWAETDGDGSDNLLHDLLHSVGIGDNGEGASPICSAIGSFGKLWDSEQSVDDLFMEALSYAQDIVDSLTIDDFYIALGKLFMAAAEKNFQAAESNRKADEAVKELMITSDPEYVVMDRYIPWMRVYPNTSIKFVIFPGSRIPGTWNVQCVSKPEDTYSQKIQLPEKTEMETSWPGCNFCHPGRFLCCFDEKAQAIAAVEKLLGRDSSRREIEDLKKTVEELKRELSK